MAFKIKQNDTLPVLPFTIFQPDGVTPQDLTEVTTINIVVRVKGGTNASPVIFKKPCVKETQSGGTIGKGHFKFVAADTANPGNFEYEFELVWSDGDIQTVPVEGYLDLVIIDDIG